LGLRLKRVRSLIGRLRWDDNGHNPQPGGFAHSSGNQPKQIFRVPSESMVPTYGVGSHVLVDLNAYVAAEPQRGDVIIFHPPSRADQNVCGVQ